jgi:hypothetical protein
MSSEGLVDQLHPLAFLLGTWRGEGQGLWDRENPFRYTEEITFSFVPSKPFLIYSQRTRAADDGRPMHMETGYLRPGGGNRVELALAQPTGITETHAGTVDDQTLDLTAGHIGLTATALNVTAVQRRVWREGDTLQYLVRIAMNDEPLADHLSASLALV